MKSRTRDELLVIDSDSTDRTRGMGRGRGRARRDPLPGCCPPTVAIGSRARPYRKSLYETCGRRSSSGRHGRSQLAPATWSAGRLGPAHRRRASAIRQGLLPAPDRSRGGRSQGGRRRQVTELVARPFINLFYPELSGLIQPLSAKGRPSQLVWRQSRSLRAMRWRWATCSTCPNAVGLDRLGQWTSNAEIQRNQDIEGLSRSSFCHHAGDGKAARRTAQGPASLPRPLDH